MRAHYLVKGTSLGKETVLADSGRAGEVAAGVGRVRREAFSTSSLPTTRHVVDQRTVDVGASEADGIEKEVCIRYKVLLVG